jgi:hypothetical protein
VVLRRGGRGAVVNIDLLDELELWAGSELSDRALLSAVDRCLSARAALPQNANPLLTMEATMAGIAGEAAPAFLERVR